jgi:hypothetical protein
VGVRLDPERRLNRATVLADAGAPGRQRSPADERHDAGGVQHARIVQADVAAPLGRRLGELAEHHEVG